MGKGYSLNPSYQGNYNSISLSSNPEMIFYKPYSQNTFMHSTIDYTINTSGTSGMTKNAFDSYLLLDGKPKATTTMDTNALRVVLIAVPELLNLLLLPVMA